MAEISTTIFEMLRGEIASLAIKPGERLNEAEICNRFSVTRPPVRTAFQRLQDIGLIEVTPYKGARATLISLASVRQMILMRTAVESWIIRDFIASHPSPILLEELEHIVRLQKILAQEQEVDEKEFFRLDSSFHQFWFDRMHCSKIWKWIQENINYERFRMLDFVGTLGYQNIVRDHEKLLAAIQENHPEAVASLLSMHLNAGLERMGNLIREDYKEYFDLDEKDNGYWVAYNQRLRSEQG